MIMLGTSALFCNHNNHVMCIQMLFLHGLIDYTVAFIVAIYLMSLSVEFFLKCLGIISLIFMITVVIYFLRYDMLKI